MEDENKFHNNESSATIENNDDETADDVKSKCWSQREALPGEPHCVICGRYGEYICDETNDDICSLECKQTLLTRLAKSQAAVCRPPPKRLSTTDECFYVRDSHAQTLPPNDQIESLRKKLGICVRGYNSNMIGIPPPILSFSDCNNLPEKLLHNIEVSGYELPTPVQMQAIPAALNGKSLLVSAETGSGKTASFLIPIISNCANAQTKLCTLILAPTRELAIQIEEQAKALGKGLPFKTALVVGGDPMAGQLHRIRQGVEAIIATPGRLIDLLTKHDMELNEISTLVLDEVDCMLERGFREQVMQIFNALSQPQVLMYSATITKEVEKMTGLMVKDMVTITIGIPNKPNGSVKQIPIWVETKQKKKKIFDILLSKQHFKPPVLVFVGSRMGADLLAEAITVSTGVKALSIHGEKSMKDRREVIRCFMTGEVSVLVATGVLGRGVEMLNVRQVIVFDMPNSIKEYVHQIGRASRVGGEEGVAMVFMNEQDNKLFGELVNVLKSSGAPIPKEITNSQLVSSSSSSRHRKRKHHGY
ncbi:DEAD-box ATP-dependent RNA helicase 41 [Impatiens glandulifera]|uniref:DEAD-box ATP-dependent RNA helicase 41 n=1 Tax=Impatiens glandulifera TaxID=253017 RepID=UPI001FB16ABF|nr:DEAD-box ATP-dependent RNA helicase 41 [Impatiens glandulifera]XP_047323335.1 DEAD-box ATP-dependent RNA helicase 41 [Impatiens glandulifera]